VDDCSGSQQRSPRVSGQSFRHWPLRSVAKKRGPASRISTHGRENGVMMGKAGVDGSASQSVYSATIERRTVMSSGFPPKTQMETHQYVLRRKASQECKPK
jgi:hypothetical protein